MSIAAKVGNWNDRKFGRSDMLSERPVIWRTIDRVVGLLYVRGW